MPHLLSAVTRAVAKARDWRARLAAALDVLSHPVTMPDFSEGLQAIPDLPPGCRIERDPEDGWVVLGLDESVLTWGASAREAADDAWQIYRAFEHSEAG